MADQPHILVVEDRRDWQEILRNAILAKGYQPHSANSYEEAMAALSSHKFELALVDPVLDTADPFNRGGLSVIKEIRKVDPELPVIIITGSFTPDLKTSLHMLCPEAPVLAKESWNPVEFDSLIHKFMGQSHPPQPVRENGQAQTASQSTQAATPPPAQRALSQPRVLLVENRVDWQTIVTNVLEEAGYFWRVANTAQEALLEMEKESFHLVILDLKLQTADLPLPSSQGWLLLDYLVEARPKSQILILSGRASPGDVADLMKRYPIIDFIEKQRFTPDAIKTAVDQATQAPELRIQTFGRFRLWRNGQAIEMWERPQAETVAKLLLVRRARGGRIVAADELITHLWPESDEESGRKKLLPLISNARHTLEPDIEPRDSNFILRSGSGYFFELSGVSWDLIDFRSQLEQGRQFFEAGRWPEAIAALEQGQALYRGDFLAEDRFSDWAIDMRREITTEFRDLLMLLADAHANLGQYGPAIQACELALRKDPLLESVYRRLMRFHYCNQEKGQALKVYRDCLKLFEEMFGESPTPATRRLHEAIANDAPLDCEPVQ